jgi:hypothetical protein
MEQDAWMSETGVSYQLGERALHGKTRAPLTVRYIGPLPPINCQTSSAARAVSSSITGDLWLGVEYDDPHRGKHSGTYEGIQVFVTREAGAGAFIKLKPGVLVRGKTFVEAIEERYGSIAPVGAPGTDSDRNGADAPGPSRVSESVMLGSSGGAIVVEAPGLDAVRRKVGRLEKIREMGLEDQWVYGSGGTAVGREVLRERLQSTLHLARGRSGGGRAYGSGLTLLNLSRNLLSLWEDVAEIVNCLPGLQTLVLK